MNPFTDFTVNSNFDLESEKYHGNVPKNFKLSELTFVGKTPCKAEGPS